MLYVLPAVGLKGGEIMAERRDVVIGRYNPLKYTDGEQIVHPEKGRKWLLTAVLPPNLGGVKKHRTVYGSESQAKVELQKFVGEKNEELKKSRVGLMGRNISSITFEEYLQQWLESPREVKKRTLETYRGYARHIIKAMGHMLVREIEPYHVAEYKEMMLKKGLSPCTINKHLSLISVVLDDASSPEKGLIDSNPVTKVKRLKSNNVNKKVENCLDGVELNVLLDKLGRLYQMRRIPTKQLIEEDFEVLRELGYTERELKSPKALHKFKATRLYPIVRLVAVTGLRLSEALALTWRNVNFTDGMIRVYESSHYAKEIDHHLNTTKEGKPKSLIDLDEEDMEFLRCHKEDQRQEKLRCEGRWEENDLVFPASNGAYLRNEHVSREFTYFARSIGFSNFTFHGLRHTHCTLLLGWGAGYFDVMDRLGHQSITTTHGYAHAAKVKKKSELGKLFNGVLRNDDS